MFTCFHCLGTVVNNNIFCQSRAVPFIADIKPDKGPEEGGYIATITGRNLGFLDIDCDIIFGGQKGLKPAVTDAWDKIEVTVPPCSNCGNTKVFASCSGLNSNKKIIYNNECYGPVMVEGTTIYKKYTRIIF